MLTIMSCITLLIIAITGVLYFNYQDKKKRRINNLNKQHHGIGKYPDTVVLFLFQYLRQNILLRISNKDKLTSSSTSPIQKLLYRHACNGLSEDTQSLHNQKKLPLVLIVFLPLYK